jgi:hypothetical protein
LDIGIYYCILEILEHFPKAVLGIGAWWGWKYHEVALTAKTAIAVA